MFATPIPKRVRLVDLSAGESAWTLPLILLKTARVINTNRPTKILAFADHTALVFLFLKKVMFWVNFGVTVSEDIYLSEYLREQRFGQVRKKLISWLYPGADRIAVLSPVHKRDLVENFGLASKKVVVYHNWLSPRFQNDRYIPLRKRGIDILFVGRLEKQKQLGLFLQTVSRIKQDRPKIRVVIVGEGSQRRHLGEEVKALELDKNITLVGYRKNPFPYYGRAKIFLLTSRYEGQPLVFLEAMNAGTPIVTLPYKGISAGVVVKTETGLIAKGVADAAKKIVRLLVNESEWKNMSLSARHYLKQKYGQNLETALKTLLG